MDTMPALPASEVGSTPPPAFSTHSDKATPIYPVKLPNNDDRFKLELHTAQSLLPNRPLVAEIVDMINESYAVHLKLGIMTVRRIPEPEYFDQEMEHKHVLLVVVFEANSNHVVATAGFKPISDYDCELSLYAAKGQGKGVGSYTLSVLEKVAVDCGFRRISGHAIREHGLVEFYERRGYKVVAEEYIPLDKDMGATMAQRLKEFHIALMEKFLV